MELEMGAIIRQLRKNLGMGQQKLANALGVSVPAVSKWECGKAYPDITLLPLLAKTLNTSVDALFSYPEALSEAEIEEITTKCANTFDKKGFDAGYAMLEQLLADNPNNIFLQCSLGTILSMYSGKFPNGKRKQLLNKSIMLCKPAAECNNAKLQRMGQKMLTSLYIMNEQYDLAEASLRSYMCEEDAASDPTLAIILVRKNEPEKAEEIFQRSLFSAINNCETALHGIAQIASIKKDEASFVAVQKKILDLSQLFEVGAFPGKGLSPYISLCQHYAQKEMPDELLEALQGFAQSLSNWNTPYDFSSSRFFNKMSSNDVELFDNSMQEAVLQITSELKKHRSVIHSSQIMAKIEQIEKILPYHS